MIKVAIAGVGNCASSLVQGVEWYRTYPGESTGLMSPVIEGYVPGDIEFVAAFDVDENKIGRDLGEAIFLGENNTRDLHVEGVASVKIYDVPVQRGPILDGLGSTLMHNRISHLDDNPDEFPNALDRIIPVLRQSHADVLVSYMPVGSTAATEFYAQCALEAKCAFLNAVPTPIATNKYWQRLFSEAGIPLAGDDIKSQLGATILHQRLVSLFEERGITIDRTFQLNFGGNMDFYNMLEKSRLTDKRASKTNAVNDMLAQPLDSSRIHIGPSDYVEWLGDRKWAYIRCEGRGFSGTPINVELKLEVWDSPNSAGIVIDVIRMLRHARDIGSSGVIDDLEPFFKSPGLKER